MIFSKLAVSASLAALALSQPLHLHHAHKREAEAEPEALVDYVTVTSVTYVTEGAAEVPVAATSTGAAAVASSTSTHAATTFAYVAPASSSSSSSSTEAAATTASSASSSSSSSSASVGSGGALGITYTPYTSSGQCKSESEVKSDIAKLSGFDVIRLYGVDCSQVSYVLSAITSSQKLFIGLYFMDQIEAGVETIASAVKATSRGWDVVEAIGVGNEIVNSGGSVSEVAGYVSTARSALKSAGYTGSVVAVDTFIAVINNPGLCALSDYMAVNAHAYFDGGIVAANAGSWALEQIQRVYEACEGAGYTKKVQIVESGWPHQGDTNGVAIPGTSQQEAAISSLKSSIGNDCYLFAAYDELWKSPGSYGVEQYWGIY